MRGEGLVSSSSLSQAVMEKTRLPSSPRPYTSSSLETRRFVKDRIETKLPASTSNKSREAKLMRTTERIKDMTGMARVGSARMSRQTLKAGSRLVLDSLAEAHLFVL